MCHFFDMHLPSEEDGAKACGIFSETKEMFEKHEISSENCVSLSVNNTNAMTERKTCSQVSGKKIKISLK